jgi:hypothetical protein
MNLMKFVGTFAKEFQGPYHTEIFFITREIKFFFFALCEFS